MHKQKLLQLSGNISNTPVSSALVENIDHFLASSVHDMKNSVTSLLAGLEKTLTVAEMEKLSTYSELVQVNQEAKRIRNQLVQLLIAYKLGQKIYPFDPQEICLSDFLYELEVQYRSLVKIHRITMDIRVDADLYWYFDEDLIGGVIGNAINNAARFARNRILISAETLGNKLVFRIEDDGCGYTDQILQKHGDFMRSVSFYEGNTGLGLYFATLAARMHRNYRHAGELHLENGGSLGGACFIFRLP